MELQVIKLWNEANVDTSKGYLCYMIDKDTSNTIANGFTFGGIVFSLSTPAQINISNIPNIPEAGFPFAYLGKEDEYYELSFANAIPFYLTALGTIKAIRVNNGALKTEVKSYTTIEELKVFKLAHNF